MDVRLNRDGLLNIISAAFLASAIGYSAIGVSTRGCAAPRLERGDAVLDTRDRNPCDMAEPADSGRGRPGMRLLSS